MDLFRESMDSYRSHESWLQKDLFRFVIDKSYFTDLGIRIHESYS